MSSIHYYFFIFLIKLYKSKQILFPKHMKTYKEIKLTINHCPTVDYGCSDRN